MNAEQVGAAHVAADAFGGHGKMTVGLIRFEHCGSEKTRSAKTRAGSRYRFKGIGVCVKYIGATCPLDVNIDKAGRNYSLLSIESFTAGGFGFNLTDLCYDAIFYENGSGLVLVGSFKQSAICNEQAL